MHFSSAKSLSIVNAERQYAWDGQESFQNRTGQVDALGDSFATSSVNRCYLTPSSCSSPGYFSQNDAEGAILVRAVKFSVANGQPVIINISANGGLDE